RAASLGRGGGGHPAPGTDACAGRCRSERSGLLWVIGPPPAAAGRTDVAPVCGGAPCQRWDDRLSGLVLRPLGQARYHGMAAHLGSRLVAYESGGPLRDPPPQSAGENASAWRAHCRLLVAGKKPMAEPDLA